MPTLDELIFTLRNTHYSLAEAAHVAELHRETIRRLSQRNLIPGAAKYGSYRLYEKTAFNGWVAQYESRGKYRHGVIDMEDMIALFKCNPVPMTIDEVAELGNINKHTMRYRIRKLRERGFIVKVEGTRPYKYTLVEK